VLGLSVGLQACAQAVDAGAVAAPQAPLGERVGLLIQAFNYTDDYINSFSVNGQGGGNMSESGPDDVGGGGVCCVSYRPGTPLPIKVKVRWTASYCLYREMTKYGPTPDRRRGIWKEVEVYVTEQPAIDPRAFEVHFFPDGHVEVAITKGNSMVRMKREVDATGRRPGVIHNYPRCTDDAQR
jgi:hypothetical protein